MSRYLLAHLEGDPALISEAGFTALHQPGHIFDDMQGYAMGWANNQGFMAPELLEPLDTELKNYDSLTVLFHDGDWLGYKSMAFLIPEAEYGMILVTAFAILLILAVLLVTSYLVLLPENKIDLASLLRFAPDLGLLVMLITLLSIAIGVIWIGLARSAWAQRAKSSRRAMTREALDLPE